ncbi:MAG: DUF5103 domain-containing protein [Bacteroidales bacterium]|nr:DUF5103 domain-containing protein [Bacteroidales bacterium]
MKTLISFLFFSIPFSLILIAQNDLSNDYYQENFIRNSDYIYKDNIKTVLVYKEGFEMDMPVLLLNSDERLVFRFDDLGGDYKKYEYTVVHCDSDWNTSDLMPNEYLESFTDDFIDEFQYSVNTMQAYTHYWKILPNDVITWRLSGNYLLKVYENGDPDDVIFTRRFFVIDPKVNIMANVRKPANISERDTRQEVRFTIQTAGIQLSDPYREIDVTIMQNGRWDNAITDLKPRLISGTELVYDHDGINVFDAGNAFRYFDLKSLRYNSFRVAAIEYDPLTGYQVYLHDDEVKKKNVFETVQESMNGRFLIKTEDMNYTNFEADYATVNFFLPYDTPLIQGKLYVMGALTYWQFLPEAELNYNYDRQGFEGALVLKQGYYNYHYLLLPNISKIGDIGFTEGNFFENNNEYNFFIYFKPLGGRYDQLINVTNILTFPN